LHWFKKAFPSSFPILQILLFLVHVQTIPELSMGQVQDLHHMVTNQDQHWFEQMK